MKILIILIGTSLSWLSTPLSCANHNPNRLDANQKKKEQIRHGKNGENGRNGENGQNGEDGQNGGNGGNGGDGGPGWWRGGNGGNGSNGGDSSDNVTVEQTYGQVDEREYKILKQICQQTIDSTVSQICGSSSIFGNENILQAACKQKIAPYLLQIGTPAAQKLWKEYENIEWSYPAITNI